MVHGQRHHIVALFGVRGLKQGETWEAGALGTVAPLWSAWIETGVSLDSS